MKTIPAHHSRHIASHSQRLNHPGILGNVSFPILLLLASLLRTKRIHGHSGYKNSFLGGKHRITNLCPAEQDLPYGWSPLWGLLANSPGTDRKVTKEQPCGVYKERQLLHTRKWILVGRFGFRSSSDMRSMQYSWSCECLQ